MFETDKIDEKMKQNFEMKMKENYSQGYYFAVGLLKLLERQEFPRITSDDDKLEESKDQVAHLSADDFK